MPRMYAFCTDAWCYPFRFVCAINSPLGGICQALVAVNYLRFQVGDKRGEVLYKMPMNLVTQTAELEDLARRLQLASLLRSIRSFCANIHSGRNSASFKRRAMALKA